MIKTFFLTVVIALSLTACDSPFGDFNSGSVNGAYASTDGKDTYTFSSTGEVRTKTFGMLKAITYTLEGKTIKFQFQGGMPRMFVVNPDGTLTTDTSTLLRKASQDK